MGNGDDVALLIASIHGNERAGTPLLRRLADHLQQHPRQMAGRQVVLVPVANPDGCAHHTRANVHGVDLNRNFPAANRQLTDASGAAPLCEPESAVIYGLIKRYHPRRIVSLHEPLACVDYDGPGKALAARMAGLCGLPVRKLGGRPGSLGSYAGIDRHIPIITLELPRDAAGMSADALWARYGTALIAAVVHPEAPGQGSATGGR
jgi:protein MpaA